MSERTLKDLSETSWTANSTSIENISTGCLLSIAESMKKISNNYESLLDSVEYYKKQTIIIRDDLRTAEKRIAAYKGILKRLKNKQ